MNKMYFAFNKAIAASSIGMLCFAVSCENKEYEAEKKKNGELTTKVTDLSKKFEAASAEAKAYRDLTLKGLLEKLPPMVKAIDDSAILAVNISSSNASFLGTSTPNNAVTSQKITDLKDKKLSEISGIAAAA